MQVHVSYTDTVLVLISPAYKHGENSACVLQLLQQLWWRFGVTRVKAEVSSDVPAHNRVIIRGYNIDNNKD